MARHFGAGMLRVSDLAERPSNQLIIDYTTDSFRQQVVRSSKAKEALSTLRNINWPAAAREYRSIAKELARQKAVSIKAGREMTPLWYLGSEEKLTGASEVLDIVQLQTAKIEGKYLLARLAQSSHETMLCIRSGRKARLRPIRKAQIYLHTATSHKGCVYIFVRLAGRPFNVVLDVLSGRRLGRLESSAPLRPVGLLSLNDQLVLIAWSGQGKSGKRFKAWTTNPPARGGWSEGQEIVGAERFSVVAPYVNGSRVMAVASSDRGVVLCQLFGPIGGSKRLHNC